MRTNRRRCGGEGKCGVWSGNWSLVTACGAQPTGPAGGGGGGVGAVWGHAGPGGVGVGAGTGRGLASCPGKMPSLKSHCFRHVQRCYIIYVFTDVLRHAFSPHYSARCFPSFSRACVMPRCCFCATYHAGL